MKITIEGTRGEGKSSIAEYFARKIRNMGLPGNPNSVQVLIVEEGFPRQQSLHEIERVEKEGVVIWVKNS